MKKRIQIINNILFGVITIFTIYIFLPHQNQGIKLKIGDIAPRDIIAPYTFPVLKPEVEFQKEQGNAVFETPPILKRINIREPIIEFLDSLGISKNLNTSFHIPGDILEKFPARIVRSKRRKIKNIISKIVNNGIIDDKSVLQTTRSKWVKIMDKNKYKNVRIEGIFTKSTALEYLKEQLIKVIKREEDVLSIIRVMDALLVPNLTLDTYHTNIAKENAKKNIKREKGMILKGEIITRAHDLITPEIVNKLYSLEVYKFQHFKNKGGRKALFNILFIIFIVSFYCLGINIWGRNKWNQGSALAISFFSILLITGLYRLITLHSFGMLYLLPVSAGVILLTLSIDLQYGFVFALFISIILSFYTGLRMFLPLPLLLGSVVGAANARQIRDRAHFWMVALDIGALTAISIFFVEILKSTSISLIGKYIIYGVINGIISAVLVFFLLPLFERFFNFSSNLTYLEFGDLNKPLLRKLAVEASGTYHHSIIVGTLAEAGAEAIGANSLLTRVGSCYHDIGKMERPEYFAENQTGKRNPHNSVPPKLSALILISHVKEGERLAREYKLPQKIVDIILQHHGTTLITPFYEKAKVEKEGVDEQSFRYPGPKPDSKEAVIVMLADSIEAKARSLEESTPQRLKEVVSSVIKGKVEDGQLDNAPISLKDLKLLEDAFYRVLLGIFHTRPTYPEEEKKNERNSQ